jgi:hypothetical protein
LLTVNISWIKLSIPLNLSDSWLQTKAITSTKKKIKIFK